MACHRSAPYKATVAVVAYKLIDFRPASKESQTRRLRGEWQQHVPCSAGNHRQSSDRIEPSAAIALFSRLQWIYLIRRECYDFRAPGGVFVNVKRDLAFIYTPDSDFSDGRERRRENVKVKATLSPSFSFHPRMLLDVLRGLRFNFRFFCDSPVF